MLNLIATAVAPAIPVWMVQLNVEFTGAGRRAAGDDELEPMAELMMRTEDVCSVVVVPLQAGLAVTVGLSAPDAAAALDRAQALVSSCARYAGLGAVAVRQVRVIADPVAGRA